MKNKVNQRKNKEIPKNADLKNVLFPLLSIDFCPIKSLDC